MSGEKSSTIISNPSHTSYLTHLFKLLNEKMKRTCIVHHSMWACVRAPGHAVLPTYF